MKKKVACLTTIAILSSTLAPSAFASTYTVQKGDTLTHIAKKYNTSISELKKRNSLKSDLILINQKLSVPDQSVTVKAASAKSSSQNSTYTVKKGDTLIKIANKYKISLSNLMKWNGLDHHIIYPGQKLKVSSGTTANQSADKTSNKKGTSSSTPSDSSQYIVQKGDSLWKIGNKLGVSVKQLKDWNQLSSDIIYVGQKLKVSAKSNSANNNSGKTSKPSAPVVEAASTYKVQSGDTLSEISLKYGITVDALKKLNQLTSDLIFVGQTLKVSGSSDHDVNIIEESGQTINVQAVINEAKKFLGIPYVWGGTTPDGFDCSGFIYYVFKTVGMDIGRYSTEGYYSRSYYVNTPQIGDLVFFENTYKEGISHLGIYIGNNEFIHADSSGVRITSLDNSYYKKHFEGFKRFY